MGTPPADVLRDRLIAKDLADANAQSINTALSVSGVPMLLTLGNAPDPVEVNTEAEADRINRQLQEGSFFTREELDAIKPSLSVRIGSALEDTIINPLKDTGNAVLDKLSALGHFGLSGLSVLALLALGVGLVALARVLPSRGR